MATSTTRKRSPKATPAPAPERTPADVMADAPDGYATAPNPEAAARALGMPNGKTFRRVLRDTFGNYVSRGGTWDDRTRAYVWAYRNASPDRRAAIVASFKTGDALPPEA